MSGLKSVSTLPPAEFKKATAKEKIRSLKKKLIRLQEKMYAENKFSMLIILQGMDTAGKDSAVKHVFEGINPAGCKVKSFKFPSEEEQAHHFLWRVSKECPETRYIQIFNRSQYEHVLENRINKEMDEAKMDTCLKEINAFEKGLQEHNTVVLKFYLHVTKAIQLERLEERKNNPRKQWKYQQEDAANISRHDEYLKLYDTILKKSEIPWHIIPADKKWHKNYLILKLVVETLEKQFL